MFVTAEMPFSLRTRAATLTSPRVAAGEEGRPSLVCDFRILHQGIICNCIDPFKGLREQQSQPVFVKAFMFGLVSL